MSKAIKTETVSGMNNSTEYNITPNPSNLVALADEFPYTATRDNPTDESKVIFETTYKGYHIIIKSICGMFPTAYVDVKMKDLLEVRWNERSKVPFEITYIGNMIHGSTKLLPETGKYATGDDRKGQFIGWDYAHFGDYNPIMPELGGTHYSIAMICHDAIKFIDNCVIPEREAINEVKRANRAASKKSRK